MANSKLVGALPAYEHRLPVGMGNSELQYEPHDLARPVVVEHDGSVTRIVVPMPGLYVPVPRWVGDLDLLALVVAPVWWVVTLIVRTWLRLPKPPRAVFEVSNERFKVTMTDPASGEATMFDWPRSTVAEARASRHDRGLWLNVPGHVKELYLADLPQETIERIEAAISSTLASAAAGNAR